MNWRAKQQQLLVTSSWLFLINWYQIMKNAYLSFVSNSPIYGGRLHSEGPSTTVLPLATDAWLRYHFRLLAGLLPLKWMQQTTVQSHSLQKALYTLLTVRAGNSHTHAPPQTPPCPNKTEIWEMVWCGEAGWDKSVTPEYTGSFTQLSAVGLKNKIQSIFVYF